MEAFAALADDTRRQIYEVLASGEQSVNDLVARFEVSQPAISQHLKILRESGLVRVRPVAQRRLYSVNPAGGARPKVKKGPACLRFYEAAGHGLCLTVARSGVEFRALVLDRVAFKNVCISLNGEHHLHNLSGRHNFLVPHPKKLLSWLSIDRRCARKAG